MTAHKRRRNSYNRALHACSHRSYQERKADPAIRACLQHLLEITPEDASERQGIRMALDDLKIPQNTMQKIWLNWLDK
jgi:hypothetical protein